VVTAAQIQRRYGVTDDHAAAMLKEADRNGDGVLSKLEFLAFCARVGPPLFHTKHSAQLTSCLFLRRQVEYAEGGDPRWIEQVFYQIDAAPNGGNGDGKISRKEFTDFLRRNCRPAEWEKMKGQVGALFDGVDASGDGVSDGFIDLGEFQQLMKHKVVAVGHSVKRAHLVHELNFQLLAAAILRRAVVTTAWVSNASQRPPLASAAGGGVSAAAAAGGVSGCGGAGAGAGGGCGSSDGNAKRPASPSPEETPPNKRAKLGRRVKGEASDRALALLLSQTRSQTPLGLPMHLSTGTGATAGGGAGNSNDTTFQRPGPGAGGRGGRGGSKDKPTGGARAAPSVLRNLSASSTGSIGSNFSISNLSLAGSLGSVLCGSEHATTVPDGTFADLDYSAVATISAQGGRGGGGGTGCHTSVPITVLRRCQRLLRLAGAARPWHIRHPLVGRAEPQSLLPAGWRGRGFHVW
jgi:hypothetical protein